MLANSRLYHHFHNTSDKSSIKGLGLALVIDQGDCVRVPENCLAPDSHVCNRKIAQLVQDLASWLLQLQVKREQFSLIVISAGIYFCKSLGHLPAPGIPLSHNKGGTLAY